MDCLVLDLSVMEWRVDDGYWQTFKGHVLRLETSEKGWDRRLVDLLPLLSKFGRNHDK